MKQAQPISGMPGRPCAEPLKKGLAFLNPGFHFDSRASMAPLPRSLAVTAALLLAVAFTSLLIPSSHAQSDDSALAPANSPATGLPTLSGKAQVGETLEEYETFTVSLSNASIAEATAKGMIRNDDATLGALPALAQAQTVVRGPYLQSGTSSSVIVKWRTDEATDSVVRYGLDPDSLTLLASDSESTTEHAVQLTGLSADVKYFYSVGTSSVTLAGGDSDHFVVTAPVPGTAKPTRIWVIGDSGTADRSARAVRDYFLDFTGSRDPDLWIMLGDNAYNDGTDNEYQRAVFNTYRQVLPRTVLWPTLGNHGAGTSDSTTESGPYYDIFSLPRNGEAGGVASGTEAYYSFDYGNLHFVCLNSETDLSPDGAMMTWLEADLAANDKEWIIAFWHRNPYSRGSANSDTDSQQIALRQNAVPLLERYGVDLVLTAHSHAYERSYLIDGHYGLSDTFTDAMKKNPGDGSATGDGAYQKPATVGAPHAGAVYVVAGTAGVIKTQGWLDHPAMAVSFKILGSMVLDVNGNRLDAKFLGSTRIGDSIRDAFTILKVLNAAPTFDSPAAFYAAENQTAAGTVRASDGDSEDDITGYAITGGADRSFFSIGATSGELTFKTAPNFEDAQDQDTGNDYVVEVQATSGTGTREKTATQTITVTVSASAISGNGSVPPPPKNVRAVKEKGGVRLTWQPPDGSAVTGYRIERRRGAGHASGPRRSAGGPGDHHTLVEDTGSADTGYTDESAEKGVEYEYRVTARNEAGPGEASDWVRAGPAASNTPATGAPTIGGTARVGETLTADTSGIADADGLTGATFSYQWLADDGTSDTEITGATAQTYTPSDADAGKSIKVRVSFVDDAGNEETLTAASTDTIVTWSATLTVGEDASVIPKTSGYSAWGMDGSLSTDTFTQGGTTYRVQVLAHRSGGLILVVNQTLQADFTLGIGEAQYQRRDGWRPSTMFTDAYWWEAADLNWSAGDAVEVSLTLASEAGAPLPQLPLAPPTAWFRLAPETHNGVDAFTFRLHFSEDIATGREAFRDHSFEVTGGSVSGVERVNGLNRLWEITVAPDPAGDVTIALPAGVACEVPGAICTADGRQLHNRLEFTVAGPEPVAAAPNNAASGAPSISGLARVNRVLRVHTSAIADPDGMDDAQFGYQWTAGGSDIDGATGASFALTPDRLGQAIGVRVSFTDDAGYQETQASLSTMPVQPADQCSATGSTPTPRSIAVGSVPVVVESTAEKYYVLYVLHQLNGETAVEIPLSVTLGQDGSTTLAEELSPLPPGRYRVDEFPVAEPGDLDGDCVDDITELGDLGAMNPMNRAPEISPVDGVVAIPDRATFEAMSYQGAFADAYLRHLEFVKFYLFDMDTARPLVYFQNTRTHRLHPWFGTAIGLWSGQLPWADDYMKGEIVYHPNVEAADGSLGVYRFEFEPLDETYTFEAVAYANEVLAASMPLLENNLAYHPMRADALSLYHTERALYDASRVDVLLEEDIFPDVDFIALNEAEGYGFLRAMSLEERPHPRDVVIYETLPNELSRVAGIITTVPQTPLSHVNLRAVQDGVPNAFIRGALDNEDIDDLIDSFVHYTVGADGWTLRAATPAEVEAHYAASATSQAQVPQRNLAVTQITALSDIGFGDWTAFGVKAANVAVLGTLGLGAGTVPDGFAVPFYFYDEFMKHNGFYDDIADMLADPAFQTDFETQEDELKALRKQIKKGETPQWIIEALQAMHATYPEGQSLRYRSSTNNEDLPGFSGAGLYDSKTQDPDETAEDGIDKSIKGVWASLWNFRAFTEREFHRVDHLAAAMGVLVHPNFSDELANGVAVSFDPFSGRDGSYYVNTQLGEDLVTNPEAHSVPEEMLLHPDGTYTVLSRSNQAPAGELLMSDAQIEQLRLALGTIHDRFAVLYGIASGEQFAMEIEFKITSGNTLAIKQARPWVFSAAGDDDAAGDDPADGEAAGDDDPADDDDPAGDDAADDDAAGDDPADDADAASDDDPADEPTAVWSATMTTERVFRGYGYYSTSSKQAGSLFPASFEVDGTTYTVTMIETAGWMYIGTDRELPFGFVLELDGTRFASSDASYQSYTYGHIYEWRRTDLSWSTGDTVKIRMLGAAEEIRINAPATGVPTISGTVQVGQTLTVDTSAIADPDGMADASFAYQWTAAGTVIDGATGSSLTLTPDERGQTVRVRVSFTDDAGFSESLDSRRTQPVAAAPNNAASGAPTISGMARVNRVLRAHTSGIADPDGLDDAQFGYQWTAGGSDIDGATGASFALTPDMAGRAVGVRVSFTDDAGYQETRASLSTMPVQPADQCSATGSAPTPRSIAVGSVPVVVESTAEKYYVLYVLHQLNGETAVDIPVSVTLGQDGTTTLSEQLSPLPAERYRVDEFLVAEPGDLDGDCVDDITEFSDLGTMNPLSPARAVRLADGAVAIPDREKFEALSYKGNDIEFDRHLIDLEFVKFYLVGMDTDRPVVYFMNTETHRLHPYFANAIGLYSHPLWNWPRQGIMKGEIVYHPNVVAPDGSLGVYRFEFEPQDAYSFEAVAYAYEVLAASMPLLERNFAYYPMPARALPLYHEQRALYDESRVDVLLEEDIFPDVDFIALNRAEGYGFLRVMSLEERPHPRDVVIYETLPNELSRVAGIITTVPQTPLSHVNLRAVQDGVPNAFIRGALDNEDIDDLIDSFVHYTVGADGWTLRAATPAEVEAHYAASATSQAQVPQRNLAVTQITALSDIGFGDWTAFGVKAANVAVLGTLGFPAGTVPVGFAVPFYFYDEFMKHNGFYDDIADMLADPEFQTDFDTQEDELKALRKTIKKGETPQWIIEALQAMHATYPEGQSLRYRSSTNNEDLPGFSGAGLYDSKTQDPDETAEDGIDKSIKGVWASLWNFRAFTEREFHRVDHLAAAMGVLVHPNFSDELANGVAVSFDPFSGRDGSYYVNTQLGEDLVTNPEAHSVPEEMLLHPDGTYTVLSRSNQIPAGELLMSDAQIEQLRLALGTLHDRFAVLYGVEPGEQFAMEIEFKITSDNVLSIKQARPWVFSAGPVSSGAERAPGEQPDRPATGAPTLSGTAQVGETLTANTSGIADADGLENVTFSYQWLADDTTIQGATGFSYTLADADAGKAIKVQVSFMDDAGNAETLTSAATGAVAAAQPAEPPAKPRGLSATALHDSVTLTWNDPGDDSITGYVILRRNRETDTQGQFRELVADTGTAATTYTDGTVAAGTPYTYRIKAINGAGTSERSRWFHIDTPSAPAPEPASEPANSAATGAPAISGTARVGETLTADTSGIADADGLTNAAFSYQWLADDTAIQGATGFTCTLADADAGKAIKVRASFTDDAGNAETLTSAATAAVAGPAAAPLTASFMDVPAEHDGDSAFTLRMAFSEPLSWMNGRRLREDVVAVAGGRATSASRVNRRRDLWQLTVEPDSLADVTVTLAAGAACDSPAAVCTKDGRALSNTISATVLGPATPRHLTGTAGADTLAGRDGNDVLTGGLGADALSGGLGHDTLVGDDGDATVNNADEGNDLLYGGSGDDLLYGDGGNDALYGDDGASDPLAGNDLLYGGRGDDLLFGDGGDDALYGNAGDDTLDGGAGTDTLTGGTGADTFVFAAGHGADTITDFFPEEGDRIDLSAFADLGGLASLTLTAAGTDTVLDLSAHGGGTVRLQGIAAADLLAADFLWP